jgi:cell division septum initiation protein DivIVA
MEGKVGLKDENEQLRLRIQQLEEKLRQFESSTPDAQRSAAVQEQELLDGTFALPPLDRCESLSLADIRRYSRQLLMPEVGVEGTARRASLGD